MHHIEKLKKCGSVPGLGLGTNVAPLGKPVAQSKPLLLHQGAETIQGTVYWVQAHLGYGRHLGAIKLN